jgi:hypothetical protein
MSSRACARSSTPGRRSARRCRRPGRRDDDAQVGHAATVVTGRAARPLASAPFRPPPHLLSRTHVPPRPHPRWDLDLARPAAPGTRRARRLRDVAGCGRVGRGDRPPCPGDRLPAPGCLDHSRQAAWAGRRPPAPSPRAPSQPESLPAPRGGACRAAAVPDPAAHGAPQQRSAGPSLSRRLLTRRRTRLAARPLTTAQTGRCGRARPTRPRTRGSGAAHTSVRGILHAVTRDRPRPGATRYPGVSYPRRGHAAPRLRAPARPA